LPGYLEIDFVEHCGGIKIVGDFVHSLVMTNAGPNVWRSRSVTMHTSLSTLSGYGPHCHFRCAVSRAITTPPS
jgi:hypothetical protein